ncbi:MAG: hypothetical protein IJ857_07960 [Lachnospiraceae bacterium]|nr:hypothetical protein [Lachnospiraceae bacterium]
MFRITNKMADNVNIYNINGNKTGLDKLNSQMSTRKKYSDPMEDPLTSIRSLRYRASLSELTQHLEKNVTDAMSWTDSTQTAIDTAKEIMRSLKAEYTSAANGTNENNDRRTYYENMVNVVNEYFATGNTTNENRYIFSGARTGDSLTFTDRNFADRAEEHGGVFPDDHVDTFKYKSIKEIFDLEDVESYSYTARKGLTGSDGFSGVKENEILSLNSTDGNESNVQNVEVYRLRLSYEDLDKTQEGISGDDTRKSLTLYVNGVQYPVEMIENDYEKDQDSYSGSSIFLNTTTGNLLFGSDMKDLVSEALLGKEEVYFCYDKFRFETGDVKPEHFFDCVDVGLTEPVVYSDHQQSISYNIGDGQEIKVNVNADRVFTLDARRDLNELRDAMNAVDTARGKYDRHKEMSEDGIKYNSDDREKIEYLMNAAKKELEFVTEKVNNMLSNGMTKSEKYFDMVNLAGTDMGSVVNRLNLIRNRLTETKATTNEQASDNENIDISTVAVDVNSATLSYNAALQVTGKISQQSLVNFL